MGKRELKALEREQAARHAARVAVYATLWADPRYVRMNDRLQALNRAVSYAVTYPQLADETKARARFKRYHRRVQAVEAAAFAKAGLTF